MQILNHLIRSVAASELQFRQLLQEICINVSTRLDIQHVSMVLEGFVMGEIIFDENFVKSIFETIETVDLLQLRLVSSTWKELIDNVLVKRFKEIVFVACENDKTDFVKLILNHPRSSKLDFIFSIWNSRSLVLTLPLIFGNAESCFFMNSLGILLIGYSQRIFKVLLHHFLCRRGTPK